MRIEVDISEIRIVHEVEVSGTIEVHHVHEFIPHHEPAKRAVLTHGAIEKQDD